MRIDDLEKEKQLIKLAKQGDEEAMQALIALHLPLIRMLASRIHISYMDREVFVQAGSIGLIEAIKRYVCCREVKLITYAVPWILGEMKKAVRRETALGISLDGEVDMGEKSLANTIGIEDGIDLAAVDLRLAMEKLDEDLRMLICLRYFRDKTQKETAQLLKKSQAQISRMERQALDHLHALLA